MEKELLKWKGIEKKKDKGMSVILVLILIFILILAIFNLIVNFEKAGGPFLILFILMVSLLLIYVVWGFLKEDSIIEYTMTDEFVIRKPISKLKIINSLFRLFIFQEKLFITFIPVFRSRMLISSYNSLSHYRINKDGYIFVFPIYFIYSFRLIPDNNEKKIISILEKKGIVRKD
jgi:hypothetical protein